MEGKGSKGRGGGTDGTGRGMEGRLTRLSIKRARPPGSFAGADAGSSGAMSLAKGGECAAIVGAVDSFGDPDAGAGGGEEDERAGACPPQAARAGESCC